LAGFGGAGICNLPSLPFVLWGNNGRERMHRLGSLRFSISFRGSRGFVRTRNFTLRARSTLGLIGNDGSFLDLPAFRKGR
jgi:hypothetical protein